jgi:hypothetical protein
VSSVLNDLKTLPPDRFASIHIFEKIPHVFEGNLGNYVDWKTDLGSRLDVDPRAIALVGSASVGISLSPGKYGNDFHLGSDIDVAVISNHWFEASWRFLRSTGARRLSMTPEAQYSLRKHVDTYVYYGTIATDFVLQYMPYGAGWLRALAHMASVTPTVGRSVRVRLYRDFDSLRGYQLRSVKQAQAHFSAL